MRLLVAEDDPRLRKTLVHIFEQNKFSVDAVSNGEDALTYAQSMEYDGLVLDIMMPGRDGLQVLHTLRQSGVTTPALFLTARTEVEQRVEGLDAGAEDLDAFGLDDPELTVTVQYTAEDEEGNQTEETFTLSVSRDPAERAAAAEADGDETESEDITAYVRVGESKIVYQIAGTSYEKLMAATYDDLRHREVFAADFGEVTGLEVTLEGSTYQLTSEGDGEDRTFFYGEEELETGDLQSALEGLSAASFTDESPDGKEEIALTVTLDNENVQEVEIRLYRCDGEQCLAVVDGRSVSLVPRSSVVDLIESINAIVL